MSRPIIFKHKWWRFWRRSYWGLNPWRWDTPDLTKDFEIDGFHSPTDGLGGTFRISKVRSQPNDEGIELIVTAESHAERLRPDENVKWFGDEE